MSKTTNKKALKRAIATSKTSRFYCWIEIAWPNVKPFMLNLVSHISSGNIKESEKALQNILRATRRAVVRPAPSIEIDSARVDRQYLILLYRGFLTATAQELSRLSLTSGKEQWNPYSESLPQWLGKRTDRVEITLKEKTTKSTPKEVKHLGNILLSKRDRDILGVELNKLFEPYPF